MNQHIGRYFLYLFVLLFTVPAASAQQADTTRTDSVPQISFIESTRELGKKEASKSVLKFQTDIITAKQNELIVSLRKKTQKAKEYLKSGIDTIDIHNEFEKIESRFEIAGEGIFTHKGTTQTFRNLSTTYKIIHELLNRANAQKSELDNYQMKLDDFMYSIDSFLSNPILYSLPDDSTAVANYLQKVAGLSLETKPVDSMLKKAIANVHGLQRQVDADVNKLEVSLEEIERYQAILSSKIFKREFDDFGGQIGISRPFNEIVHISLLKAQITLWFYAENNWGLLLFTLSMIIALTFFLRSLRKLMSKSNLLHPTFEGQLVLKYPVFSALIIVLNLAQFIFPAPPFVFSAVFWVLSAVSLSVLSKDIFKHFWWRVWEVMFVLFLFACVHNLLLLASSFERTGMAVLAFAGVVFGIVVLTKGKNQVPRERLLFYFIAFMVFMELASLMANFLGQYNLSKTLLTSGYFNLLIGFMFLWTIRLIDQMLAIAFKFYIGQNRKLFYINFERLGEKTPLFIYVLLFLGWFVLVGRNFYEFKLLADPFKSFLYSERTIGDFTFTISSILVFFVIIGSSLVLSKIVSFFASDRLYGQGENKKKRKAGVGSWLLLVRVSILIVGFLLAFAAAGLPMERITLVLGALGVGIGFGLQPLVNNLVSGLIIAFEKPVNVGDIVEINGQSGTVNEVNWIQE